jgi:hypothetical protein
MLQSSLRSLQTRTDSECALGPKPASLTVLLPFPTSDATTCCQLRFTKHFVSLSDPYTITPAESEGMTETGNFLVSQKIVVSGSIARKNIQPVFDK